MLAEIFKYKPLQTSTKQIRLLELQSKVGDIVHCSLAHFDLNDNVHYQALSYTWGPVAPTYKILIDGQTFRLRENLYQFLKTIASQSSTSKTAQNFGKRYIWIDQICINQDDIVERTQQVSIMGIIYRRALQVVVWLGTSDEYTETAVTYLNGLNEASATEKPTHEQMAAVNQLCNRPYWSRLWIVQEVLLARSLVILCGEHQVLPESLSTLNDGTWFVTQGPITTRRTLGYLFREDLKTSEHESLGSIVMAFYNNQCQDPRDKVYGLRGLLPRTIQDRIEVDYSKSVEEVFFEAAGVIIEEQSHHRRVNIASGVDGLGRTMFPQQLDIGDGWDFRGYYLSDRWKDGRIFGSEEAENAWLLEKVKEFFMQFV